MRSPRTSIASALFIGAAVLAVGARANEPAPLRANVDEPRAFGYRVGDLVTREVLIDLPQRLQLDEASLPSVGRIGHALELRAISRGTEGGAASGTRLRLRFEYQLFGAPSATRSYELPPLLLRFEGAPRAEELRVDAWPVVVAPLAPEPPSARRGLGELRPDNPPPLRDTGFERDVLRVAAGVCAALLLYLAAVYWGLPWRDRGRRPFSQAYRTLRAQRSPTESGWRVMHAAFDQTAGRVVFAESVDAFVTQAPRFAALRNDIFAFFARSRAAFFVPSAAASAAGQRDWLLAFARACRDAERGTA